MQHFDRNPEIHTSGDNRGNISTGTQKNRKTSRIASEEEMESGSALRCRTITEARPQSIYFVPTALWQVKTVLET